jgi:uncharacterized protein
MLNNNKNCTKSDTSGVTDEIISIGYITFFEGGKIMRESGYYTRGAVVFLIIFVLFILLIPYARAGSVIVYRQTTFFRIMKLADTLDELIKGLLGETTAGSGLFLMGADRIHTYGMKIPIDVVYLNPLGQVIDLEEHLNPNREGIACEGTRHVVELNAGDIRREHINIGEQWHWQ